LILGEQKKFKEEKLFFFGQQLVLKIFGRFFYENLKNIQKSFKNIECMKKGRLSLKNGKPRGRLYFVFNFSPHDFICVENSRLMSQAQAF
jgi:hypothetical protein